MSRELQNILSSGEISEIFIGNTEEGDVVLTESETEALLANGIPSLKVGDVDAGDYAQIGTDGTLLLFGDATVWEDVTFELSSYKLDSTAGSLQYNHSNNSITMDSTGSLANDDDTLVFNCQIPHKAKAGSTAKLHMHWEQPDDSDYEFLVQYRIQKNGEAKDTSWSTAATVDMTNNVFTYVSGTLIQITELLEVDLTDVPISSLIQVQLTRNDTISGTDIEALAVDFHFEIDSLGSSTEYVK